MIDEINNNLLELKKKLAKHKPKTIHSNEIRNLCENICLLWNNIKEDIDSVFVNKNQKYFDEVLNESRKIHPLKNSLKNNVNKLESEFYNNLIFKTKKPVVNNHEITRTSNVITNLLDQISNEDEKIFLLEANDCLLISKFRPAIIMAWCATMWNIYSKIEMIGFKNFGVCFSQKYNKKTKNVHKKQDLLYFKDSDIIQICEDLGIYDSNIRKTLIDCLNLRNKCSHPGKYHPGIKKTEAFFEDIISNVFRMNI